MATKQNAESEEKPIWLKRSSEEVESLIMKLASQGITSEKIGLILRDTYGIPSTKLLVGKITKVIAKSKLKHEPSDLKHLEKKSENLKLHFEKNKQDKKAKRSLQITAAKTIKLRKYYERRK